MKILDQMSVFLLLAGIGLPLCEIIYKFPDNRGAGLWGYGPLVIAGLIATAMLCVVKRQLVWKRGVLAVAFGLLACCGDMFNILVPYETWIGRGMPTWGTPRWHTSEQILHQDEVPRLMQRSPCGRFMIVAYHNSKTGVDDIILGELHGGKVLVAEHGVGLLEKLSVEWQKDNVVLWPGKIVPLPFRDANSR